ncbi:MAG: hypothetical protein H0T89_04050 [Deltaproteobacteria bacterium]|nr:hypothetical protein [Deltaproteobacteria bacterium]
MTGANILRQITATAYPPGSPTTPEHARVLSLAYDGTLDDCDREHAPVRLLTSIQESAWGADAPRVDLPAVTFEYGDPKISLAMPSSPYPGTPWGTSPHSQNLAWGYRRTGDRWPTVEGMLVDLDGDGLIDRLDNASDPSGDGACKAQWRRNKGPTAGSSSTMPTFEVAEDILLPRLKWRGAGTNAPPGGSATADLNASNYEGCALNGQVTAYRNADAPNFCHDGSLCQFSSNPDAPTGVPFCYPYGLECPDGFGPNDPFRTYLAYRWLDADADGLTDLVTAVHGDIAHYDIVKGDLLDPSGTPYPTTPEPFGAWPPCPQMDRCKQVDAKCMTGATTCPAGGGPCTTNWGVVNSCLALAPKVACHELIKEPAVDPSVILAPPPGGGSPPVVREPYTRCEGLYPWFIYKNLGNGTFAPAPTIKYQPVPLESDVGDSNLNGPQVTAQFHGVQDFDGDGILDAIANSQYAGVGADNWWFVWLGDGTGGFAPKAHVVITRHGADLSVVGSSYASSSTEGFAQSSAGLIDANGDGLPDHWVLTPNLNANLAFQDGVRHVLAGSPSSGEVDTPIYSPSGVKPGGDTESSDIVRDTLTFGQPILSGVVKTTTRPVDVDHDGRIDVVRTPNGSTTPKVFFNVGGQFGLPAAGPVSYPGVQHGYERKIVASVDVEPIWELTADLIDLDGNGIMEAAFTAIAAGLGRAEHPPTAPPPRLLTKVKNGRGATTTVTYASMHDKTAVEQNPDDPWSAGRPRATPHNQWVVKSLSTVDSFAGTTSTTSYAYKNPRHGADNEGRFSFRGFEQVTTLATSGARTVQLYGYSPDWSGRLVETRVHPVAAETTVTDEVRSIERITWEELTLFGGAIKTHHATVTEKLACANGQTVATCTASNASGYARATSTLTPIASDTMPDVPLLWQETQSLLQAGTADADGDRQTLRGFKLDATGSAYRLLPTTSEKQVRSSGAWITFAKSEQTWDASLRVPETSEVWVDGLDANRAITRFEYDLGTGNLIARWKPMQNAASGPSASFQYDGRKLFVASETNELGHQRDFGYEYGTGTKLVTSGPNATTCPGFCPAGETCLPKEQAAIRVDGLGRTIEAWETVSEDGCTYVYHQTTIATYVDAATGTVPSSVTQRARVDSSELTWTEEKTELDGHGRPIKQTVFVQGTAPLDQITTFAYRNDGTLQTVEVPDPEANTAARVAYAYGFDSLGRATSIRRPDAPAAADRSGVNIAYDGLTQTTTEVVGAAGGNAAVSKSIKDRLGRLVEVHEQTVPGAWAITQYKYGPDDLVTSVVDPENVTTALEHDLVGRRTLIARHGRTWKYRYDKNGNLISEQVPGSSGPLTDTNYTTTIAYDNLDRPLSKLVGQRDLSPADQVAFAGNTEVFSYDLGGNMKGRLRYWESYGPNASTASVVSGSRFTTQDQRFLTQHVLEVAGYPRTERLFYQNFNLLGGVRSTYYYDEMGAGSQYTQSQMFYDARGLPSQIYVFRGFYPVLTSIAVQTRNVAGLVTKRRSTPVTGGPMNYVESNWTYDQLGRVKSQVVAKDPAPAEVARQDLTYFGNDDPKTLTHYLGTTGQRLDYGYDHRHQLTSVTSVTPGYFNANYYFGSAGRFTRATESQTVSPLPPGSEVKPRDVNYVYGGTDPEQVMALTNISDGTTYANYTYDPAGNQTRQCYGGIDPETPGSVCAGEWIDFVYDGKDQLRRATKKQPGLVYGSEEYGIPVGSEEYWYDGFGQRIAVVKRDNLGVTTEMVWFIGDTEAHYDGTGALTRVFSNVSMGTPVARHDRTGDTTTAIEFQFHGLASSTIAAVANDGAINASFSYTPFGSVVEATSVPGSTVGAEAHPRRHNDKYVDQLSSLAYYGARYYDRTLIGWTQADPLYLRLPALAQLSSPRRANLHTFTLQNPMRYMDPDGLDASPSQPGRGAHMGPCEAGPNGGCTYDSGPAAYDGETKWLNGWSGTKDCGSSAPGVCDPNAAGYYASRPGLPDGDASRLSTSTIRDMPSPTVRGSPGAVVAQRVMQVCGRVCDKIGTSVTAAVRATADQLNRGAQWLVNPIDWTRLTTIVQTNASQFTNINPAIYRQLERQLRVDGAASIFRALHKAERTLQAHVAKLPSLPYKSQVEGTIRNVTSQIETIKLFIQDNGL